MTYISTIILIITCIFNVVLACRQTSDCEVGQWCSYHSNGKRFCKDYANLGDSCDVFPVAAEDFSACNHTHHYCYAPKLCLDGDFTGHCEEKTKLYELGECCIKDIQCKSGYCGGEFCEELVTTIVERFRDTITTTIFLTLANVISSITQIVLPMVNGGKDQ